VSKPSNDIYLEPGPRRSGAQHSAQGGAIAFVVGPTAASAPRLNSVSEGLVFFISSRSRVYSLKDRDPVGRSGVGRWHFCNGRV
jgi:hypothetical protein